MEVRVRRGGIYYATFTAEGVVFKAMPRLTKDAVKALVAKFNLKYVGRNPNMLDEAVFA